MVGECTRINLDFQGWVLVEIVANLDIVVPTAPAIKVNVLGSNSSPINDNHPNPLDNRDTVKKIPPNNGMKLPLCL